MLSLTEKISIQKMPVSDDRQWYVLHFMTKPGRSTPRKYIDAFNKAGHSVELFAPIIRPASLINGKVEYREKLLTYYYIFVNGTFPEIKELCSLPNNSLSFLIDRGSEKRYATISEADMENFRIYARIHTNTIPFFNIENVDLTEGDLVEVVGGKYNGLKGRFIPKPRSHKGNLVIAVTGKIGATVWSIDAKNIRILEFARDTRRQYDLVDSFIDKFLPMLRRFHSSEYLTDKDKTLLNIFNLRMGVVTPANHKAEAKLLATLMCVQYLLGDMPAFRHTKEKYEERKSVITNIWTLALVDLLSGVTFNDKTKLKAALATLPTPSEQLTKTQRQLIAEFNHYLPTTANNR